LEYENLLMHDRIQHIGPTHTTWHINPHRKGNSYPLKDKEIIAKIREKAEARQAIQDKIAMAAAMLADTEEAARIRALREAEVQKEREEAEEAIRLYEEVRCDLEALKAAENKDQDAIAACQRKYDKAKKIAEKEIQEREAKEAEQAREAANKEKMEAQIARDLSEAQKRESNKALLEVFLDCEEQRLVDANPNTNPTWKVQKWEQRLVDARRRKKPKEIKEAKIMLEQAEEKYDEELAEAQHIEYIAQKVLDFKITMS